MQKSRPTILNLAITKLKKDYYTASGNIHFRKIIKKRDKMIKGIQALIDSGVTIESEDGKELQKSEVPLLDNEELVDLFEMVIERSADLVNQPDNSQ